LISVDLKKEKIMGQIMLHIDSPVSLLRNSGVSVVERTLVLDEIENLRVHVLPYMQDCIQENTLILSESHLGDYVTRVASKLERAWFTKLAVNILQPEAVPPIELLAAVELRYLFELILDDIADRSTERCSGPTLHLQVGVSKATYLAEVLIGTAMESLGLALEKASVTSQSAIMAFKSWARKNIRVSVAQCQDLDYEHIRLEYVTQNTALDLIDGTTAQDLANCFFLGGIIVGASSEKLDRLHKIGQSIGMLMQMRDDLVDYINDPEIINKEPLLDFKYGHKKLPLVSAYNHADKLGQQEILALLQQSDYSPEDITRIQKLILNPSALAYQASLSNEFIRQIDENLDALGASEAATTLRTFVHTYLKLDI
jgi:octaprenyl-diphosphate synthase